MAVVFNYGANFIPVQQKLQLPADKESVTVFLLSDTLNMISS